MAPLILEGKTLGEKHRHYNQLLSNATETYQKLDQIDYNDPDIDNLFKIDIACHQKDVQYILSVLKCEDMLYVSKAIKKCKWLITDNVYADIINPIYLHNELFPQMTSKAKRKLLLHIRLSLKDENRVEQFFDFLKQLDLESALMWLPNCSNSFIEKVIETHSAKMHHTLIKRLCEKSINFLEFYCQKTLELCDQSIAIESSTFLVHNDFEKYLNVIEKSLKDGNPNINLGCKVTKKIMKNCPQRIYDNLEMYLYSIDIPTFAKYMRKEEILHYLKLYIKEKENFYWLFSVKNMQHFLKRLPVNKRFEFVKENFIDKRTSLSKENNKTPYQWYQFAPFDVAIMDLKKIIQAESNPAERKSILNILLICAGRKMKYIQSLIDFYRSNHINEPYKFKSMFVKSLIKRTKTHEYDENTWAYINELFISMEVYEKNNKNVHECVNAIILYNVTHSKAVPEIIERKFVFDTFVSVHRHLAADNKEKLFCYLYNYLFITINEFDVSNDRSFSKTATALGNILRLLRDWDKNISEYPAVIIKIRQLIQIKKDLGCYLPLLDYCLSKRMRRIFFEESLFLNPTEKACINVLKHKPQLFDLHKNDVQNIYLDSELKLKRLLNIIRIYWSQTIALQLKTIYYEKLQLKINYKSAVSGLCILLPLKESKEFIEQYAPSSDKVNWSESDKHQLTIQKFLGKKMHLARPQPPLTVALLYARGDYLQYVLPSISALLYNISSAKGRTHVINVLNAPVSLQKHGIRVVLDKLTYMEIKNIFIQKWGSTKNKSIRSCIFKVMFNMLCDENDPSVAQEIWELLSTFIDNLTAEEDMRIYKTLANVYIVPLPIKVLFWNKSYNFFKSLPEKANCFNLYRRVKMSIREIFEFLSVDSAADVFKEFFKTDFHTKYLDENVELLILFLLSTKDKKIQHDRYDQVFLSILENIILLSRNENSNIKHFCTYTINVIVKNLIKHFCIVLQENMIMPVALFNDILQSLEKSVSKIENYISLTNLKLAISYMQIVDSIITAEKENLQENEVYKKYANDNFSLYQLTIPMFSQVLIQHLKEDVSDMYSSVYLHFADALDYIFDECILFDNFIRNRRAYYKLETLHTLIQTDDFIELQLLVLKLLPKYIHTDPEKTLKFDILNIISQHPSHEVKMHYSCYVRNMELDNI